MSNVANVSSDGVGDKPANGTAPTSHPAQQPLRPATKEKCNSIFLNLLVLKSQEMTSSTLIREFWQTARCDEFHDMKEVRNDYAEFLKQQSGSEKTLARILAYEQTDVDESVALQATAHGTKCSSRSH